MYMDYKIKLFAGVVLVRLLYGIYVYNNTQSEEELEGLKFKFFAVAFLGMMAALRHFKI